MGDVFISYSRRDKEFVRKLYQEILESTDRTEHDIWVDWEDIPATADWWHEIQKGIEGASNFLFVISPDSARSEVCGEEIAYAVANNKRLVPILHREVIEEADQSRIHPQISAHNWIFYREDDDPQAALHRLVESLDTDLDHVNTHTRLLVRAKEWKEAKDDPSLLLRGSDLTHIEAWMTQTINKSPAPTQLQIEYITNSRRAETRRQRAFLAGVSTALVIAIALTILSGFLYRRAEDQRQLAVENAERATIAQGAAEFGQATAFHAQETGVALYLFSQTQAAAARDSEATAVQQGGISSSLAFAAQAQLELDGNFPELGVLLALESLEGFPYTLQAERVLGVAIQRSRGRGLFTAADTVISEAYWSPDETRILTGAWDNRAVIWDAETNEILIEFTLHEGPIQGAAWAPDGSLVATSSLDGVVYVWNPDDGTVAYQFTDSVVGVNGVSWSPDGTMLAVGSIDGSVRVWDLTRGEDLLAHTLIGHDKPVWNVNWSPDGVWLTSAGADEIVNLWHVPGMTTTEITEPNITLGSNNDAVWDAVWSPDNEHLATVANNGLVMAWHIGDYDPAAKNAIKPEWVGTGHQDAALSVVWSPDGSHFATAGRDNQIILWDVSNGDEVLTIFTEMQQRRGSGLTDSGIRSLDWSADGKHLLSANADGTVRLWNVGNLNSTGDELLSFADHEGIILDIAWSPDGSQILTTAGDTTAKIWDALTGEQIAAFSDRSGTFSAGWSPAGDMILTSHGDSTAKIHDVASGEVASTLAGHTAAILKAVWSPDGQYILTTSLDNSAKIWDAATGDALLTLPHESAVISGAWSTDSARVVTGSADTIGRVWDVASGELLLTLEGHRGVIQNIAWSPKGTSIATASDDSSARIWNASTGELMHVLADHSSAVIDIAWAPNNQRLITTSGDGTAKFWDALSGAEVYTMTPHARGVVSVDWSPDGSFVVTGGGDGNAKIWRGFQNVEELIEYARECCAIRPLTDVERVQFGLDSTES